MKTVTLQIGNSDDKLSQVQWADYVADVKARLHAYSVDMHFHGCSPGDARWQNAAWVFTVRSLVMKALKREIKEMRKVYGQCSAAWTEGATKFI